MRKHSIASHLSTPATSSSHQTLQEPKFTQRKQYTSLEKKLNLWLGIYLPALPLEVFTHIDHHNLETETESRPLAVCSDQQRSSQIVICNRTAQEYGIRAGTRLSAAYGLVETLQIYQRDLQMEQQVLESIAAWAGQFTPTVSISHGQTLLLEVAGSARLFGGMDCLLERITDGLRRLGYQYIISLAPTPRAAALLAKTNHHNLRLSDSAGLRSHLAPLALTHLELQEVHLKRLKKMGVHCIGDLIRLPRDGLARRIGPDLLNLLDQTFDRQPDPQILYTPPAKFQRRLTLPMEIYRVEGLMFAAQRLLLELTTVLQAQCCAVQSLCWKLYHHDNSNTLININLVTPSRSTRHLSELLYQRLENTLLPAPVQRIALTTSTFQKLSDRNRDIFPGTAEEVQSDKTELLEHLRARLGVETVYGVCITPEHRPEKAWTSCPPGYTESISSLANRPLWLLHTPIRLQVQNGQPQWNGPLQLPDEFERIESGWWDGQEVARDYFSAHSLENERLWVFRELNRQQNWFLHGIFA